MINALEYWPHRATTNLRNPMPKWEGRNCGGNATGAQCFCKRLKISCIIEKTGTDDCSLELR